MSHFKRFDLNVFKESINSTGNDLQTKRDMWCNLAKSAEKCERYEDMCQFTSQVVDLVTASGEDLTSEERNLLSVAYKNVIGARRQSWRTIISEESSTSGGSDMAAFKTQLESELVSISLDILAQLEDKLEPVAQSGTASESKVFYLKMIGDYYRYLAESVKDRVDANPAFSVNGDEDVDALHGQVKAEASKLGDEKFKVKYGCNPDSILSCNDAGEVRSKVKHCLRHVLDYAKQAHKFYGSAYEIAHEKLKPTHPIRLGLALNYSVCFYEILKKKEEACDLAKQAFDDAISKLDKLEESDYKDSTLIMQLLRDNLTLWTSSDDQEEEEEMGVEDVSGNEDDY